MVSLYAGKKDHAATRIQLFFRSRIKNRNLNNGPPSRSTELRARIEALKKRHQKDGNIKQMEEEFYGAMLNKISQEIFLENKSSVNEKQHLQLSMSNISGQPVAVLRLVIQQVGPTLDLMDRHVQIV